VEGEVRVNVGLGDQDQVDRANVVPAEEMEDQLSRCYDGKAGNQEQWRWRWHVAAAAFSLGAPSHQH
jgi:hypothetical protein